MWIIENMANRQLSRVLNGHFRKATREPDEYIIYAMDPENIKVWWVLVRNMVGNNNEWENGYFLFKLEAPNDFPTSPPSFYAQHSNGVYGVNVKCCISIGEFHSDQYRGVLGMRGFAVELANGMMNWEFLTKLGGINLLRTTAEEKKNISQNSLQYIAENFPEQLKLLENAYSVYSAKWSLSNVNNSTRKRLNFQNTVFELREEDNPTGSTAGAASANNDTNDCS